MEVTTREIVLVKDELNAVRYAAGFVPHILQNTYEKQTDKKSSQFVQCLGDTAVVSSHTDSFQYTQEWLKKLDRGGLFPVNDETFLFFATIEKLVQSLLPSRLGRLKQDTTKGEVVQLVMNHTLVQQLWAVLSQDVYDDYVLELLQEIVQSTLRPTV